MNPYYNVRPRYTSGSPAMVDAQTAARVAKQEKSAYEDALSGIMGTELRERAEREGCKGIAERVMCEQRQNRVNGFVVYDLIMCVEYWRPQRGNSDMAVEPNCERESDHQLETPTLTMDGENNAIITAHCKLCGATAKSKPIMLCVEWPPFSGYPR